MNGIAQQQRSNLRDRHNVTDSIHDMQNAPKDIQDLQQGYNLRSLVYFHINSPKVGESELDLIPDSKKGSIHWYLQLTVGSRKTQHYIGPDSDTIHKLINNEKQL